MYGALQNRRYFNNQSQTNQDYDLDQLHCVYELHFFLNNQYQSKVHAEIIHTCQTAVTTQNLFRNGNVIPGPVTLTVTKILTKK